MNSHHSLVEFKKLGIKKILLWFNEKRRIYPWRLNRTPYSVWISEIMLQQTVISTVIPYFQKWMKKYPTIFKLSESSEKEVLTFWQGLGYYSRVKNILKAAKMIINDYKGSIPDDYEQLIQLPGIGDYTSSAILSIAFNKPYPVIDANVKRVMSRVFGWRIWTILLEVKLKNILKELIFNRSPREFNESIMELGQTICFMENPLCDQCPINFFCYSYKNNLQEKIPQREKSNIIIKKTNVLILLYKNKILVYQKKEGILKDLWAFPSCPKTKNNTRQIESFIKKNITAHYFLMGPLSIQKHYYTKYKDFLYPTIYRINNINFNLSAGKWISMKQLAKYPFPSVYQKIFKELRIKLERESQL